MSMNVYENDDPQGSKLTEKHKVKLRSIRKRLEALLPELRTPVDPKIYPLIEVAMEMLFHQEQMGLHFDYNDDLFEDAHMSNEEADEAVKQVKKEIAAKKKKLPAKKPSSKKKSTKPEKAPPIVNETPSKEELAGWFDLEGPDIE